MVAHHDDDLLFLNPAMARSIRAGACVRTAFLVASDYHPHGRKRYMLARERGLRAAYARMAEMPESAWKSKRTRVNGHLLTLWTLGPRLSILEFRLPDNATAPVGRMRAMYTDGGKVSDFSGRETYDRADLTATLAAVVRAFAPRLVRTLDPSADLHGGKEYDDYHHDHVTVAKLVGDAAAGTAIQYYRDYPGRYASDNLTRQDIEDKLATFETFAAYDRDICHNLRSCDFYASLNHSQNLATPASLLPWTPAGPVKPAFTHARLMTKTGQCLGAPGWLARADGQRIVPGPCGDERFTLVNGVLKLDKVNECLTAALTVGQCSGEGHWTYAKGVLASADVRLDVLVQMEDVGGVEGVLERR